MDMSFFGRALKYAPTPPPIVYKKLKTQADTKLKTQADTKVQADNKVKTQADTKDRTESANTKVEQTILPKIQKKP